MQKNKCIFEVPLEKQEFVDIICRLKESTELVDKVDALFRNSRENLECDCCNGAGLQISHEGIVVKLLEKLYDYLVSEYEKKILNENTDMGGVTQC